MPSIHVRMNSVVHGGRNILFLFHDIDVGLIFSHIYLYNKYSSNIYIYYVCSIQAKL